MPKRGSIGDRGCRLCLHQERLCRGRQEPKPACRGALESLPMRADSHLWGRWEKAPMEKLLLPSSAGSSAVMGRREPVESEWGAGKPESYFCLSSDFSACAASIKKKKKKPQLSLISQQANPVGLLK